jgi:hypothetical protein
MTNQYCFENKFNSSQKCEKELTLTRKDHEDGYKIVASTIGLNNITHVKPIKIINIFYHDDIDVIFYYSGNIKSHNVNTSISGQMKIELKLENISAKNNDNEIEDDDVRRRLEKLYKRLKLNIFEIKEIKHINPNLFTHMPNINYNNLCNYIHDTLKDVKIKENLWEDQLGGNDEDGEEEEEEEGKYSEEEKEDDDDEEGEDDEEEYDEDEDDEDDEDDEEEDDDEGGEDDEEDDEDDNDHENKIKIDHVANNKICNFVDYSLNIIIE